MTKSPHPWQRSSPSAVVDLEAELAWLAKLSVEQFRALWRERNGQSPPKTLSKDMIARALAHWLQEERLGGLDARLRKLLASSAKTGGPPVRHVKIGSVIVREYQGKVHEVMVVPGGFCWRGEVYASLSAIARKIGGGTNWNGPRFFGLRSGEPTPSSGSPSVSAPAAKEKSHVQPGATIVNPHVAARASTGKPPADCLMNDRKRKT
jgi:hypothetical protein